MLVSTPVITLGKSSFENFLQNFFPRLCLSIQGTYHLQDPNAQVSKSRYNLYPTNA